MKFSKTQKRDFFERVSIFVQGADLVLKVSPIVATAITSVVKPSLALNVGMFSIIGSYGLSGLLDGYFKKQKYYRSLANPYLSIQEYSIDCKTNNKNGCVRTDTICFKSLAENKGKYFIFSLGKTSIRGVKIFLDEQYGLLSKIELPMETEYTIKFPESKLNDGETHTIKIFWEVEDWVDSTFIASNFSRVRECKLLKVKITFPKDGCPEKIHYYKMDNFSHNVFDTENLNLVSDVNSTDKYVEMAIKEPKEDSADAISNTYIIKWGAD